MKTSARLLLVGILVGVVLMAPPMYPQNTKDQLNALMTDVLNLKNSVKQMQDSSDQKNAEVLARLQEVMNRFSTFDSSLQSGIQKLNESITVLKANNDERSTRSLQDTRTALEAIRKNMDEGLLGLQNQVRNLGKQINDMKTAEQPLPKAADMFGQAFGELNAGFYDLAVGDFREFLRNYPNDPVRSPAAQFYIGDAFMAQKKFDQAIVEFDFTLSKYPTSDKTCSALYRKGQALAETKQTPQATETFQKVVKECPNTPEAGNAAADLKKLPRGRG